MRVRFFLIINFAALIFLGAGGALYNLQIRHGEDYASLVSNQTVASGGFIAPRGAIYFTDKNGAKIPAAINKDYDVIYAVPKEIADPEEASRIISEAFGLDAAEIKLALSKVNDQYEKLVSRATPEQVQKVHALGLKGIYLGIEPGRFYPFGVLGAHLLGFVGPSEKDGTSHGQYGLEAYEDQRLGGTSGSADKDSITAPLPGSDVATTIDINIQSQAEAILAKLIEQYRPVGGTVIVEEPATGKIMALANYPNFNPNDYSQSPVSSFLNPALQAVYEPGSIFKVITMSSGIESGSITPDTTYLDTGTVTLNGKKISNWDLAKHGPWGKLTMTNVIEHSVNTGAVFAEAKTGHKTFYNSLIQFGFKELTGIDLPGEIVGRLTPLEKDIRDINYATAAFGQGVSVTPLRLISAISAIANHGVWKRPFVIEGDGEQDDRQVISPETARQVTEMMVSAVSKAEVAAIPNYDVAGKTGTAQIPDLVHGGYLDFSEGVIHTYVGFAPAFNPKFIVLIKIDKPSAELAGQTVVPAFRNFAEFLLNYYNVPP